MTKRVMIGVGVAVAAAAALVLAYLFWWAVPVVEVARPTRGPAVEAVYATGAVEPVHWAKIASIVKGRIVDIRFRDNDVVKRGDVLMRLDDTEAKASLAEAEAREAYLRAERERISKLMERNIASTQAYQRVLSEHAAAVAATAGARQRLKDLTITAPLDGRVLRQDGNVGEFVQAGQIVFWVGKANPKRIEALVDEEDIPLVKTGQRVLVRADAFPKRTFEARVGDITPKGDPIAKNYRVRIVLGARTPLRIGMTTEVNIIVRAAENALLVPTDAVKDGSVWVVSNGRARRRRVKTGVVGDKQVQIVSGITQKDLVIIAPPADIVDGGRVSARLSGG